MLFRDIIVNGVSKEFASSVVVPPTIVVGRSQIKLYLKDTSSNFKQPLFHVLTHESLQLCGSRKRPYKILVT